MCSARGYGYGRRWTRAHKARRRLLQAARHGATDLWGPHVLPLVMAVDPQVVEFGGNFGFNDGSVLSRVYKRTRYHNATRALRWTWQVNVL